MRYAICSRERKIWIGWGRNDWDLENEGKRRRRNWIDRKRKGSVWWKQYRGACEGEILGYFVEIVDKEDEYKIVRVLGLVLAKIKEKLLGLVLRGKILGLVAADLIKLINKDFSRSSTARPMHTDSATWLRDWY